MKTTIPSTIIFFTIWTAACSVNAQPSAHRYYDLPIRDVNTNELLRVRQQYDDDLPLTFSGDVDKIIDKANNRGDKRSDELGDDEGNYISIPNLLSASTQPPAMTHSNIGSSKPPALCPSAEPSIQPTPTFDTVPTLSAATTAPASSNTGGSENAQGNTPSAPNSIPSNPPVAPPAILLPTPSQPIAVPIAGEMDPAFTVPNPTAQVQAPVLLPTSTTPGAANGSSGGSNAPAYIFTTGTPGMPTASSGSSTPVAPPSTTGTSGTPTASALLPTLSSVGDGPVASGSSGSSPSNLDTQAAPTTPSGNGVGTNVSPTGPNPSAADGNGAPSGNPGSSPTAGAAAAPNAVSGNGSPSSSPSNGAGSASSPTAGTAAAPSDLSGNGSTPGIPGNGVGTTSSPTDGTAAAPSAVSGSLSPVSPGNGAESASSPTAGTAAAPTSAASGGADESLGSGSGASSPTSDQESPSLPPLRPTPAPQASPSAQNPVILSPTIDSAPSSQAPDASDPSSTSANGMSSSSNASPTSASNKDDSMPTSAPTLMPTIESSKDGQAAANGNGAQTTGNSEQSSTNSPVAAPTLYAAADDIDGPTPSPSPIGPPTPQTLVVGENTMSLQEEGSNGQESNPNSSPISDPVTNMDLDLLPDGDGPMVGELVSIPPAAAPAESIIPEIFPVENTLIACDGSYLDRPETIEFSYSLETSTSDFEEIEKIRKLSELSLGKDISNLLLGCKARRLQSGDALGFEGIDHVPEDSKAEDATCDATEDIRNTCTVFDGILTIYISQGADFELAKYYTLTALREAMGLLDGQIAGLSKATYLGPEIVNPSAFAKPGDGPSSITPGPSSLNTSLVLFAVGGCAFAASVGLIYYLRRNGNYSSSGAATQAAGSDRQTNMLDVDRPLSPFSEMLPSAYRFDQDGNMSAILELDDESATQRSGIVVSDSGFTTDEATDEEGSVAISMGGVSTLDRLDSPILGARKRHDETMDSLLEFL